MFDGIRKRWKQAFGGNTLLEDLERSRRDNLRNDFRRYRSQADFFLTLHKMRLEVMRMECRRSGIDPDTYVITDEAIDKAHAEHLESLNRLERVLIGEPG